VVEALAEENQPSCVHKLLEDEDARLEAEEEAHLGEVDLVVVEASDAIKTTTNNTLKTVIQQILLVGRTIWPRLINWFLQESLWRNCFFYFQSRCFVKSLS
jgi:hypothetical protein